MKLSADWQSHPIVNKIVYLYTGKQDGTCSSGKVTIDYVGDGTPTGPIFTQIRLQDLPWNPGVDSVNLVANKNNVPISRGQWVHWEVLVVNNTGDNFDARIEWWIDGIKAGEYFGHKLTTSLECKTWGAVYWYPIPGGGQAPITQEQYMWMDHYYASGSRP